MNYNEFTREREYRDWWRKSQREAERRQRIREFAIKVYLRQLHCSRFLKWVLWVTRNAFDDDGGMP